MSPCYHSKSAVSILSGLPNTIVTPSLIWVGMISPSWEYLVTQKKPRKYSSNDFWQCFCVAFVQTSSLSFGSWTDSRWGGAFSRVAKLANIPRRRARVPQWVDSWHWTSMNQLCMCGPPVIILWSKESLLFHQVSFHLKRWKCMKMPFVLLLTVQGWR